MEMDAEMEKGCAAVQFTIGETRFTVCDDCCREISAEAAEILLRKLAEEFYPPLMAERRGNEENQPSDSSHKKGGAGQD